MAVETISIHREIVERCKRGDRLAQYQLYELYSKAMLNTCYRMMNSREEAEDMLQEAFVSAFRRLDSFRFESTFGAWLKRIVINHCINELKRRKLELELVEDLHRFETPSETSESSEGKWTVDMIRQAVMQLPNGYRVVFSLYALEGYDHQEIAQILNVTESTSKSQYLRAKRKLKELINR
ncbi:MAG: RNA polymerase sigma factor [Salibacteraceae bacterium]